MWSKPDLKRPRRRGGDADLQIPLWVRPSSAHNIEDYVSVVPLHQTEAARHLMAQRGLASAQKAQEASSAASTCADDSGDESDSGDEHPGADCVHGGSGVAEAVDASSAVSGALPPPSRSELLVAALRDARLRANARRLAPAASSA